VTAEAIELDRPDSRVPPVGPVAVAIGGALRAPLAGRGTDLEGDLGLHHRLSEYPDTITKRIDVVFFEQLADDPFRLWPAVRCVGARTSPARETDGRSSCTSC